MVKKYVFVLPPACPEPQPEPEAEPDPGGGGRDGEERRSLLAVNAELHGCLAACKNRIGTPWMCGSRSTSTSTCFASCVGDARTFAASAAAAAAAAAGAAASAAGAGALRLWNAHKRYTNEYELIHTGSRTLPGLSRHMPISRSFFKLWEMLVDYGDGDMALGGEGPVTAAFLAEGPGGFVESFAMWRQAAAGRAAAALDSLHCITLVSPRRSVPGWKTSSLRRLGTAVAVHAGADGTGDLYSAANVHSFVEACGGRGSCALVTADGGFDFSGDFNAQEDSSLRLVVSQAYSALLLQAPGGAFVLKVFDAASAETIALLQGLRMSYADVRLVKPLSSRPANSERYALCTGFAGAAPDLLAALGATLAHETLAPLRALAEAQPPPIRFLRAVVEYNAAHVARQASYIARTVAMIGGSGAGRASAAAEQCWGSAQGQGQGQGQAPARQRLLHRQLSKSIRWCHKYRVQIAVPVFQEYRMKLLKDD